MSLVIETGEHWAVIGPNGSGKTTLFSLLGAERHPMAGTAEVLGERIGATDLRVLRKSIGVVGHAVADRLPYHASALDIVLTGKQSLLAPWWGDFDETDRNEALERLSELRCGHLAAQSFGSCSQGERQRVLLARSLFGRHRLLLLDEPALGMDLPGREALVGALDQLAHSNPQMTSVQVVHTLEELPSTTSHALLLRDGEVVARGRAEDVLADEPLSSCFGAAFQVEAHDGRYYARAKGAW
jgi:iron complex transport system ATP-binding protein